MPHFSTIIIRYAARLMVVSLCGLWMLTAQAAPARQAMIAAAHPLAAQAGRDMLAQGGSAMDAAIAMQAVLGLVEPQSSGLGGGAFLLHYDTKKRELTSWDGRETAPMDIDPYIFAEHQADDVRAFMQAVISGHSVGVAGVPALLIKGHKTFGRLAFADTLAPAIHLAEQGFPISPQLHFFLNYDPFLRRNEIARALYYETDAQGAITARPIGDMIRLPAYAETLKKFAHNGRQNFYQPTRNSTATDILTAVQKRGSKMQAEDLRRYQAVRRANLCAPYRQYTICSMGPPSSGGIATLQILGILAHFDMPNIAPNSARAVHLISEASKLAYADRAYYAGDADFVPVPVAGLLAADYLRQRAQLISPNKANNVISHGQPIGANISFSRDASPEFTSTTHFVVQDFDGNAVSMTSSVENLFGSRIMVGGMMLNNQLTDFSFLPEKNGKPIANAIAGGKRPRSSMAPVMIFNEDDELIALLGSPGGQRIIGYVALSVIALLDWGMDMQAAIDLPRFTIPKGVIEVEAGSALAGLVDELTMRGHKVALRRQYSGLHGIMRTSDGLVGGADKRRGGQVILLNE